MKLTRASVYALRAVLHMVEHDESRPFPSYLMAEADGTPERFLLKVLKPLVSVGILVSVKGPGGGYRMAKAANKTTLLDVVEAVDGPLRGEAPTVEGADNTPLNQRLEAIAQRATEETRRQLQGVTLASLVGRGTKTK